MAQQAGDIREEPADGAWATSIPTNPRGNTVQNNERSIELNNRDRVIHSMYLIGIRKCLFNWGTMSVLSYKNKTPITMHANRIYITLRSVCPCARMYLCISNPSGIFHIFHIILRAQYSPGYEDTAWGCCYLAPVFRIALYCGI